MSKDSKIERTGTVTEHARNTWTVQLDDTDMFVKCTLSGKLRKHLIRVVVGDHVTIDLDTTDLNDPKGRITERERNSR